MTRVKDLTGQFFGRWEVLRRGKNTPCGKSKWVCLCGCGNTSEVLSNNLVRGKTKSCGCLHTEKIASHGLSKTRQYQIWADMRNRCDNPLSTGYAHYGGRGITYVQSWSDFENFWKDMEDGYSDDLTLDRIDNNKGYSKENCRWVTRSVQNMNKRKKLGSRVEYIGVDVTCRGTFCARSKANGKYRHLGTFATAIEAATAYDNAVESLIGNRPNNTPKEANV